MRLALILLLMIFSGVCLAEEGADPAPIYEFAADYGAEDIARDAYERAMQGDIPDAQAVAGWLKQMLAEPLLEVAGAAAGLIAPTLLIALVRAASIRSGGGARFLLRLMLLLGFSDLASVALDAARACLESAKEFTDAVSPAIAALLAAMGMSGTSAMISPAAAMAGGAAEGLFLNCGLPLCRIALCTAVAGNLSDAVDLSRITNLLRKAANWGAGLATTLFTALLALQGNLAQGMDGVGVRTAKFAVDSAAPVIGSGVSDAWEGYISGMMIAKNAFGMSGIAALLAAGLRPVICCLAAMLSLSLISALLALFGEKEAARAAEQAGSICQMALSLSTGALAIATVLLGAAMSAGRSLAG